MSNMVLIFLKGKGALRKLQSCKLDFSSRHNLDEKNQGKIFKDMEGNKVGQNTTIFMNAVNGT